MYHALRGLYTEDNTYFPPNATLLHLVKRVSVIETNYYTHSPPPTDHRRLELLAMQTCPKKKRTKRCKDNLKGRNEDVR